ncbi:MAG: DUF4395 family protein [Nanoarchaeota archaeon]
MALIWIAVIFKGAWLVLAAFLILALSALLGVKSSPLIVLYSLTLGHVFPSKTEKLSVEGMRFAHTLGAIFAGAACIGIYFANPVIGWMIAFWLAVMKTVSAVGLCPAYKLYGCMKSGGCCALTRRKNK